MANSLTETFLYAIPFDTFCPNKAYITQLGFERCRGKTKKRAEERRKQREKCSNVQMFTGITFPHVGARTLLYKG